MYYILDIETENTGTHIMKDNKRVLSVQIGDASNQNLYWADSREPQWALGSAKEEIAALLSRGIIFAGYNIKRFDVPILKQLERVEIPESNLLDLCEAPLAVDLRSARRFGLEEVCKECGIRVTHKQKMNERAERYKTRQDIKNQATAKAKELVKNRGWSFDFSYNHALEKIAGGTAIYDAYLEFASKDGDRTTLFYEYAIGDVISEYQLLKALEY
jgi:hypothetical protein